MVKPAVLKACEGREKKVPGYYPALDMPRGRSISPSSIAICRFGRKQSGRIGYQDVQGAA